MKIWKVKEIEWLREAYKTMSAKSIAEHLGLKTHIIESAISRYHIPCYRDTRFKPGQVAHNKGVKLGHTPENAFKPGYSPANKKAIGSICVRKRKHLHYKYIKLETGWKPLQYHVWETAHGPMPKKHFILFRDRNTMNCELHNLQLISFAENLSISANNLAAQAKRSASLKDIWYKEKLRKAYGMGPKTGYGRIIGNI